MKEIANIQKWFRYASDEILKYFEISGCSVEASDIRKTIQKCGDLIQNEYDRQYREHYGTTYEIKPPLMEEPENDFGKWFRFRTAGGTFRVRLNTLTGYSYADNRLAIQFDGSSHVYDATPEQGIAVMKRLDRITKASE